MKKFAILLLVLMLAAMSVGAIAEDTSELRGYKKGEGYQYYEFGSYPQGRDGEVEPLLWCALSVEDGKALMMTKYVIDMQQVIFESDETNIQNHDYRRIEDFAESDLCVWMNETMLPAIVGDTGLENALVQGEYGKLYPLTDDQLLTAEYGFSSARYGKNTVRCAEPTAYAQAAGVYRASNSYSPYWVANVKAAEGYKLQIVGYDGHLSYGAYTRTNIGVRPALTIDLEKCEMTGGDGTKSSPFQLKVKPGAEITPSPTPILSLSVEEDEAATKKRSAAVSATITQTAAVTPATASPTATPIVVVQGNKAAQNDSDMAQSDSSTAILSLIGDCSIGDAYQYRNRSVGLTDIIAENGTEWPFSLVNDILKADDLTAANLEVCLTDSTKHVDKVFPLVAPPENVSVLTQGGIDVTNTVNNHCFDFGTQGYDDTLATLDTAGILHFGNAVRGGKTYSNLTTIVDVKGLRFGFTGFSYPQTETLTEIGEQIAALRAAGCDIVIVSLHWGRETYTTPNSGQPKYAQKIIDMGADVVWGHHPHVLQPVQFYKGKPIFFSTGNFIFGTMSKVDPSTGIFQLQYQKTEDGAVLRKLTVIPCETQSTGDYRPFVLTDESDQEHVWDLLRNNKTYDGYENLPESFLTTGIVNFDENGAMVTESLQGN